MQLDYLPESEREYLLQVITDNKAIVVNRAQARKLVDSVVSEANSSSSKILSIKSDTLGGTRTILLPSTPSLLTIVSDLESGLLMEADDALSFFELYSVNHSGGLVQTEVILLQS